MFFGRRTDRLETPPPIKNGFETGSGNFDRSTINTMLPESTFSADRLTSPEHKLLLTAALESGDVCREAWREWSASVDLDTIDGASFRMIPLLTRKLIAEGVTDIPPRMKGISHRAWCSNQLLFQHLPSVLKLFADAGLRTLLHKGLPIAFSYYDNVGSRPMSDIDILVPSDRGEESVRLLEQNGWVSLVGSPHHDLAIKHATPFVAQGHASIDLHWNLLVDDCANPRVDDDYWAAAVRLTYGTQETLTLCAADHLLQAIVHGLSRPRHSAIYWVSDAVMIIRKTPSLDWNRLLCQASDRRFGLSIRDGLLYLDRHHTVDIPADIIEAAQRLPITRLERFESSDRVARRIGGLGRHMARYARHYPRRSLPMKCLLFPRYLQHVWWMDDPTKFVSRFARKSLGYLARR